MITNQWQRRVITVTIGLAFCTGCIREPFVRPPEASGSSDGYGLSSKAAGGSVRGGIFIETPITSTSRLVFGGHEWKRDPTGSTIGSEDLPEMGDDGIEDSFTAYVTDDPSLRLFYMLTGLGHRIYVRELDKGKWVTMKTLFIQE